MRDYGKISPKFWMGKTGRAIKAQGSEAVLVALYLMTSPHADMLGVYYLPAIYIAHDTGLVPDAAKKGLKGCIEAGFCDYDSVLELVWVRKMALFQIADRLHSKDNRVKAVEKAFLELPDCAHLRGFYEFYKGRFHLPEHPSFAKLGPGEPLASQEQEQEQDQEQEQEQDRGRLVASLAKGKGARPDTEALLAEYGITGVLARDFIAHRQSKKSVISKTVMAGYAREAAIANLAVTEAVRISIERNWQGFKADWVLPPKTGANNAMPIRAAPDYIPQELRGAGGRVIDSCAARLP